MIQYEFLLINQFEGHYKDAANNFPMQNNSNNEYE